MDMHAGRKGRLVLRNSKLWSVRFPKNDTAHFSVKLSLSSPLLPCVPPLCSQLDSRRLSDRQGERGSEQSDDWNATRYKAETATWLEHQEHQRQTERHNSVSCYYSGSQIWSKFTHKEVSYMLGFPFLTGCSTKAGPKFMLTSLLTGPHFSSQSLEL